MTTQLLRQALEALEYHRDQTRPIFSTQETIDAIRAHLAQPAPAQAERTHCNCQWEGDTQVKQCTLHAAHVEAIHEWAGRAKAAEAKLEQPAPSGMVPNDAALNTLAKMFHSGEEIEGDNGAAMMVDMALWNEGCEALESILGDEAIIDAAQQAMPLTEEQIESCSRAAHRACDANPMARWSIEFARAIERAHRIAA